MSSRHLLDTRFRAKAHRLRISSAAIGKGATGFRIMAACCCGCSERLSTSSVRFASRKSSRAMDAYIQVRQSLATSHNMLSEDIRLTISNFQISPASGTRVAGMMSFAAQLLLARVNGTAIFSHDQQILTVPGHSRASMILELCNDIHDQAVRRVGASQWPSRPPLSRRGHQDSGLASSRPTSTSSITPVLYPLDVRSSSSD